MRRLPVYPHLAELHAEAHGLLAAFRAGDPEAIAEFALHLHPAPSPAQATITDAPGRPFRGADGGAAA